MLIFSDIGHLLIRDVDILVLLVIELRTVETPLDINHISHKYPSFYVDLKISNRLVNMNLKFANSFNDVRFVYVAQPDRVVAGTSENVLVPAQPHKLSHRFSSVRVTLHQALDLALVGDWEKSELILADDCEQIGVGPAENDLQRVIVKI